MEEEEKAEEEGKEEEEEEEEEEEKKSIRQKKEEGKRRTNDNEEQEKEKSSRHERGLAAMRAQAPTRVARQPRCGVVAVGAAPRRPRAAVSSCHRRLSHVPKKSGPSDPLDFVVLPTHWFCFWVWRCVHLCIHLR